jgi:membrane associated rhomboid family serine protease
MIYMQVDVPMERLPIANWALMAVTNGAFAVQASVGYIAHVAGELGGFGIAATLVATGLVQSSRGERNLLEIWSWVTPADERPRRRKKRRVPPRPRNQSEDES